MMDCWQSPWRLAGIGTVELNKPPYNTNLAYEVDCWQSPNWRLAGIGTVELNKPPYNTIPGIWWQALLTISLPGKKACLILELGQLNCKQTTL